MNKVTIHAYRLVAPIGRMTSRQRQPPITGQMHRERAYMLQYGAFA